MVASKVPKECLRERDFFLNIRRRPGHVVKIIVPTRASKSIINALRLHGTIDLMYALILGLIYFELTVSTCYREVIDTILEFLPSLYIPPYQKGTNLLSPVANVISVSADTCKYSRSSLRVMNSLKGMSR